MRYPSDPASPSKRAGTCRPALGRFRQLSSEGHASCSTNDKIDNARSVSSHAMPRRLVSVSRGLLNYRSSLSNVSSSVTNLTEPSQLATLQPPGWGPPKAVPLPLRSEIGEPLAERRISSLSPAYILKPSPAPCPVL